MSGITHRTDAEEPAAVRLNTPANIAKRLGVELHRVEYLISSRGVKPLAWVGHTRLFSNESVQFVAEELRKIEVERRVAHACLTSSMSMPGR